MRRKMWTDERLSERFDGLDKRLDRLDTDVRELRGDIRDLKTLTVQLWGSTIVGSLGVIATLLATR
ncbi:MAG TPA: hypothetical protein VNR67_00125 [Solirubrobacterales bacterium]|nr:hypothetical protein [Solirubrobacterales bacterium]